MRNTCQACLDNPNVPSGHERLAERQLCGAWLCRSCDGRITDKPGGVDRLRRISQSKERLSLISLLEE